MGDALGAIEDPTSHRTVFVASLPHQVHATHYSTSLSPAPQVWRGICGEFPRQLNRPSAHVRHARAVRVRCAYAIRALSFSPTAPGRSRALARSQHRIALLEDPRMSHSRRLWCGTTVIVPAMLALARPASAQDAVIQGRVIDDRGDALPVATVQVPQLNVGVLTNSQGRYTIVIPGPRVSGQTVTLRVRVIGHKPSARQVVVRLGEQTQDFTLASDVNQLDAVVVTGVQEATERVKVPFSVTTLDASKLPVAASNALTELQGKLPANIVSNSGRPGAQPSVLLRGPTSINAQGRGQDPLYIVDGVIINGALPDINPQDIESVEVVKGAAGASLYGARAGNGVINITTKSGRRALEGVKFNVRSEAGVSDIERDFGLARFQALVMDERDQEFCQFLSGLPLCARTFDYRKEQARINNYPADSATTAVGFPVDPGATISGSVLRQRFQNTPWPGTSYNAVNELVDPHVYAENSVDMTGRVGGTRFYVSGSNLTEPGAIRFLQGFVRNSFRANVDQAIGSDWTVAVRTSYSRSTQ